MTDQDQHHMLQVTVQAEAASQAALATVKELCGEMLAMKAQQHSLTARLEAHFASIETTDLRVDKLEERFNSHCHDLPTH